MIFIMYIKSFSFFFFPPDKSKPNTNTMAAALVTNELGDLRCTHWLIYIVLGIFGTDFLPHLKRITHHHMFTALAHCV